MAEIPTTELPPGYRILNDGPGREVLTHDEWEHGEVFPTVEEATGRAWELAAAGAWGRAIFRRVKDKVDGK